VYDLATNYVLIDHENVQPRNLQILDAHNVRVFVFCGTNQHKISFELASQMQRLGERGQYIKISGNGKNSLDFHIAYYIGRLSVTDPKACFHIVSKDQGFDPLLAHLKSQKMKAYRVKDLAEIPTLRVAKASDREVRISAIVKNLVGRGQSKPGKLNTLMNTVNTLFAEDLDEGELMKIIKELQTRKYLKINGENVVYKLPPPDSKTD